MSSPVISRTEIAPIAWSGRLVDYVQLSRPKIAVMVLATAWLGMLGTGEVMGLARYGGSAARYQAW
jgi:hypothetical protein